MNLASAPTARSAAAHRPAVLLLELDRERRRELATGLAAAGYEVVPLVSAAEGRRFARALGSAVVVAPAAIAEAEGGALLADLEPGQAEDGGRTVVLLGESLEAPPELSERVVYLPVASLAAGEAVRRLRLALVGREVGLEPDERLEALVGDLALLPPLELVRSLARAGVSGEVELPGGQVTLEQGEVRAVRAGAARGVKAFCRLARLSGGPVRVRLGSSAVEPEIGAELRDLLITAIEDAQVEVPDPRAQLEVVLGPAFFGTVFTPLQQRILAAAQAGPTCAELLDRLPETDGALTLEIDRLEALGALRRQTPEVAVQVFTDSTADLPREVARAHGIGVVPLTVHFGDVAWRDGEELEPRRFYQMLEEGRHHPSTSPVAVREFSERYWEVIRRRDVVSVHLSGKLSLTVGHARTAVEVGLPGAREVRGGGEPPVLEVVDSGQVSIGLGLLALFAARMAARGLPAAAVAARLREMAPRVRTLFVVDTLEYLARGGRIGRARALLGELLRIKPVLGLVGGEVAPVDRVRGARAALPRIVERLAQGVAPGRPVILGVGHAKSPARADQLRRLLTERLHATEVMVAEIGPVVGTHAGPGCLGATCFQPRREEIELVAPLDGLPAIGDGA